MKIAEKIPQIKVGALVPCRSPLYPPHISSRVQGR